MESNNSSTQPSDIKYEMIGKPDYAMIRMTLKANQTVQVEPTAMAAMDTNILMKTKAKGGILAGVKRMLSRESFFMNEFTAQDSAGDLYISPALPGDMDHVFLNNSSIILQGSAFVASSMGVTINSKFQGLKGLFNGEGFFFIQATGTGDLFFNTYGAILQVPVDGEYIVDDGYIVAFEETLNYETQVVGGLKIGLTTFMSGEGIVCKFSGKGRLWIQTRQIAPFISWAWRFAPRKK